MLNKIILNNNFKLLESHAQKLLARVEFGFGTNKISYIFYLAYLITTDDYNISLFQVNKGLQLFIAKIDKFWFENRVPVHNLPEITLKRDIVRFILLRELIGFLEKTPAVNLMMPPLKKFLHDQHQQFEQRLNLDTHLENIIQQNINIAEPHEDFHYLSHIPEMISVGSGFLGALFASYCGFKLGLYYISALLENYQLSFADLHRFEKKMLGYYFTEAAVLAAVVIGVISYALMMKLVSCYQRQNIQRFRLMTIGDFNTYCKENHVLSPLTKTVEPMDNIWYRQSGLMLRQRTPMLLRAFVQSELSWLSKELPADKLLILLACCLVSEPNLLNDVPHPLPIEILRKPEAYWTNNPNFRDLKTLIQNYVRLAMIEFIHEELEAPISTHPQKKLLEQWLTDTKVKLKVEIETLILNPGASFYARYRIPKNLSIYIAALILGITGYSIFFANDFKEKYANKNNLNIETTTLEQMKNIFSWIGLLVGSPPGLLFYGTMVPKLHTSIANKINLWKEQRLATTTLFFTQRTIANSETLKAIFEGDNLSTSVNLRANQ